MRAEVNKPFTWNRYQKVPGKKNRRNEVESAKEARGSEKSELGKKRVRKPKGNLEYKSRFLRPDGCRWRRATFEKEGRLGEKSARKKGGRLFLSGAPNSRGGSTVGTCSHISRPGPNGHTQHKHKHDREKREAQTSPCHKVG